MNKAVAKVSVGMPVFNGEAHLREAVDSILSQSYEDFELIISDNASTDLTQEICRDYASKDERIRYYRNANNLGASDNYNAVFKCSRGLYFKWASSNDVIQRDFLLSCVSVLDERPDVVLCYPKTRLFEDSVDKALDYDDNLDLQFPSPVERFVEFEKRVRLNNIMNGLIRSEVLKTTNLVKAYYSSDIDLMAELSLHGKFVEIPRYLFYRRMDPETATRLKSEEEVVRHYDPECKNVMILQVWKSYKENFAAVGRAPISASEKLRLYLHLSKLMVWARLTLMEELVKAVRALDRAAAHAKGSSG